MISKHTIKQLYLMQVVAVPLIYSNMFMIKHEVNKTN